MKRYSPGGHVRGIADPIDAMVEDEEGGYFKVADVIEFLDDLEKQLFGDKNVKKRKLKANLNR